MLASQSFSWFSPSKSNKPITHTPAVVTTRTVLAPKPKYCDPPQFVPIQRVPITAPLTPSPPKKRKRVQEYDSDRVLQSSMVKDKTQRVDVETEHYDPPAKRVKAPSRAASSSAIVSPKPSRAKRAVSAVPTRLVNGLNTPERTRSPSARSRSTTAFGSLEGPIPRPCWTTHDGAFGDDLISAATVVKKLMHSYKSYFRNLDDPNDKSFEPHPTDFPFVELEYPNTNSREIFPLLVPKDEDHYSPVKEVKKSLFTIIETFLTPSQAALFGTPPDQLFPSDFSPPKPDPSRASSASPSSARSKSQSTSRTASPAPPSGDLLRTLTHANNRRDGPLFVATFSKITELLRAIKKGEYDEDGFRVDADGEDPEILGTSQFRPMPDPNPMRKVSQGWNGVPPRIWKTVVDETYQRAVGPNVPHLRKYQAWSSEVYGELETDFVSDIVHHTGLTPSSRFLDMGSGVGTVVLQAALQAGCNASGIEKMFHPARTAAIQLEQFEKRCRMWGVEPGNAELLTGDFTDDDRVREKIANADVVLCNNWAFSEKLNQSLLNHFLDMKEGAIVISLRSFIPPNFRLSEHTIGSPASILRVEERPFQSGSVSWTCGGGVYFVNTIDRSMVAEFHERLQNGEVSRSRSTRSRR